ncbi:MAG: hypothetical protein HQ472_04735 [Ignavibacteria bacterium]|nr:hypothetical protein [Ignavibacteria bacterium]
MNRILFCISIFFLGFGLLHGQQSDSAQRRYFYQPYAYGSMAMFSPWNVVINGSFDVLQLDGKNRNINELPYGVGMKNVFKNTFVHPGATISQIGWGRWFTTEVLPMNFTKEGAQWLPNYQLHLIGGGMTFRMLQEWYAYQGVSAPGAWAAGTIALYHVLNEAVENEDYVGYNSDPIADLLVFDWLGAVLFMNDDVAEFFSQTLHLTDWSQLPMITFPHGQLGNNGLYYSMKWNIPTSDKWSAWYLMGMSNMAGASYKLDGENSITIGAGVRGKNLYLVDQRVRALTLNLVATGGIFWDKNNSLMASLTASGQQDQTVIVNVYPGVFEVAGISPTIWAAWGSTGTLGIGVGVRSGIGVGYRNR